MKYKYKVIIMIIIILCVQNISVIALDGQPSPWAVAEIEKAKEIGFNVTSPSYQAPISRVTFCMFIVGLIELVEGDTIKINYSNPFSDTSSIDVLKAHQLGIVKGKGETVFAPYDDITRQEIGTMVIRMVDYLDTKLGGNYGLNYADIDTKDLDISDIDQVASWALEPIIRANAMNIMKGVGQNRIAPFDNATFEQAILLIVRTYEGLVKNMDEQTLDSFRVIQERVTVTLNERERIILYPKDLVVFPLAQQVYFLSKTEQLSHGIIEYVSNSEEPVNGSFPNQIVITANGVFKDESETMEVEISNGTDILKVVLIIRIEDVTNIPPISSGDLEFEVDEGEILVINASEIATDLDNDFVTITKYERISSSFGSAILENQPMVSKLTFSASQVSQDQVQEYKVTLTDGIVSIEALIRIHVIDTE